MTFKRHYKNIRITTAIFIVGVFGVLGITKATAAYNPQINYQGKLANSSNIAVADGQYPIIFSLYSAATGGSAVWTETDYEANQVTV